MSEIYPCSVRAEYVKLNDGRCCNDVFDGWRFHRCLNKAKEVIDGVGLCGVHLRSLKKWRSK